MTNILDSDFSIGAGLSPWIDVLGNVFTTNGTALSVAGPHTTSFDAKLYLPASTKAPGPRQIDVIYTPVIYTGNTTIAANFRDDGAGNLYSSFFDMAKGVLKVWALKPGGGAAVAQTFATPICTAGHTYLLRWNCEDAPGMTSGVKLTFSFYVVNNGVQTQQGTDYVFYDGTTALQSPAQPTGGDTGIWVSNFQTTPLLIQRITVTDDRSAVRGLSGNMPLAGVNLAGGGFGPPPIYPKPAEISYFTGKGANILRIPFLWNELQPGMLVNGTYTAAPLAAGCLAALDAIVSQASAANVKVLLDLHNYAKYHDIGTGVSPIMGTPGGPPVSAMADTWEMLASHFASAPNVIFGLMNEPACASDVWLSAVNLAIASIRATGSQHKISIAVNQTAFKPLAVSVVDPLNNYVFEIHIYFDSNNSGTSGSVVSEVIGPNRLTLSTDWARGIGKKLFLGEFGGPGNQTGLNAISNTLTYLNQNSDVWAGFTYWAGGPWNASYFTSLEPASFTNPVDKPQMSVLTRFFDLPPVAVPETYSMIGWKTPSQPVLNIPASAILALDTDPRGEPLTLVSVGGAGSSFDGVNVTYSPPIDFAGVVTFDYTIQNSDGLMSTGTITVNVTL